MRQITATSPVTPPIVFGKRRHGHVRNRQMLRRLCFIGRRLATAPEDAAGPAPRNARRTRLFLPDRVKTYKLDPNYQEWVQSPAWPSRPAPRKRGTPRKGTPPHELFIPVESASQRAPAPPPADRRAGHRRGGRTRNRDRAGELRGC